MKRVRETQPEVDSIINDLLALDNSARPVGRDETCLKWEETGILKFIPIRHDVHCDMGLFYLGRLFDLKLIVCKQIPEMGRDYVTKVVFDPKHRSIVCVCKITSPNGEQDDTVVGGVTFRPFFEQGFVELVFAAVSATRQIQGFGTRLMNHLKQFCRSNNLYHILTYADNTAIGYFEKQGFSVPLTIPKEFYDGYIKDYTHSTLMECLLTPHVENYCKMPLIFRHQKRELYRTLLSAGHKDFMYWSTKTASPDRPRSKTAGTASVRPPLDSGILKKLKWNRPSEEFLTSLHARLETLWSTLFNSSVSHPFRQPVNTAIVADYSSLIRDPMDLGTIGERIRGRDYYLSQAMFVADVNLVIKNCQTYNGEDSEYYKLSVELGLLLQKEVALLAPLT